MRNTENWIEQQINYRFNKVENIRYPLFKEISYLNKKIKTLSFLVASERRFSKLNYFDKLCPYDETTGTYIQPETIKGKRQARFANLVNSWGFSSAFVCNWCDAQGWDYDKIEELKNIPILQFSRRKNQNGKVILFPLAKEFMGAGGKNIPLNFDNIPFNNKKDILVWRGRYSGTDSDWISNIFWSESIFEKSNDIDDITTQSLHCNMPRHKVVKIMNGIKWADIAFVTTKMEYENIKISKWKSEFLSDYIQPRMTLSEQIKHKFILAMPGNDYPSNLYWALCSNSLVFLLENEWETALDSGLQPWEHYVPVSASLEDIQNKYEKMVSSPKLCQEIISNAQNYMKPFLNNDLRDAIDYETIRRYQDLIIPVFSLNKKYSYARIETNL